jgi:hypothetical protein
MKYQRGLSLNGMVLIGVGLGAVALLAMKALPPWIEYGNAVKAIKGTATDTSLKDASVAQVRAAYGKRADMDDVKSIPPAEIEITKEGGELVISFAYSKKVPLFGNTSLVFDFEASSTK